MEINDLRPLGTVLAFLAFIGIVAWVWSGKRKNAFDEASRLPLDDDAFEPDHKTPESTKN